MLIMIIIFLVFLLIQSCQLELNGQDYLKRDYSLIKPYNDGRWDVAGSAILTNSYVRLTPDQQSRAGGLWNSIPALLREWEVHLHFKVHGHGTDIYGDGFAFWYTRERLSLGPVFGNKDFFTGLGIFFDTYSNHNGPHNHGHPYVSAMVNNGSLHYDHDRDGTHTEIAGCESHFRSASFETYAAIRYKDKRLTVSMDIEGRNEWSECFSVAGVHLPIAYYFGATATTGELTDNHDIISVKVYDIGSDIVGDDTVDYTKIQPSADLFAPPRDHVDDAKGAFMSGSLSGMKLLVMIVVFILGLGVCGMVAFVIITRRQEEQRKRFY